LKEGREDSQYPQTVETSDYSIAVIQSAVDAWLDEARKAGA
jgi:predicted DNA-binding transcriptional regulator AlpA